MSEQPKPQRSKEELLKWFEERQKHPLFVDSEEFEGMSICYANPQLLPDEDEEEGEQETRTSADAARGETHMSHKVFAIPNFRGTAVDLILCNVSDPNANGVVHYAYTVGAEDDALSKRMFPWAKIREFAGEYGKKHPETVERLRNGVAYRPGEGVLDSEDGPTFASDQETIMRLGALELLANLSSGRLSTNDKDPFPHQLALQQYVRKPPRRNGPRRILVADEVGLGKTIEVGLILRDILLSRGQLEGFRCLYLTAAGLVEDAAEKLRDVLSGIFEGHHIVNTVPSFRQYGNGNYLGVHVASMQAARLFTEDRKKLLPAGIRPEIIIIDECHRAASEGDLAGVEVCWPLANRGYMAAKQLLSGEFWANSKPPQLAILMSATPFRSAAQFVNLLRLLTHGVERPHAAPFDAFGPQIMANNLRSMLQDEQTAASVVWRRQSDQGVRSWSGNRIFPNLTVLRPHQVSDDDSDTPRLPAPSNQFLALLARVKKSVVEIAAAHGQAFGGFAIAQLEKKLTSSSVAGACWLFSWAVRHCQWNTQDDYKNDRGPGTEGLRTLIRKISQRIAEYNPQATAEHATVGFPSDLFEFPANVLAHSGVLLDIQKYSKEMREDAPQANTWVADQAEISTLVDLGERLLDLGKNGGAEDAKLAWLNGVLQRHPDDRFLLFTESLQTCEVLRNTLGSRSTRCPLVGSTSKADRKQAVADLYDARTNARVLVATSAADEGLDLQVASKVVHWDLSSSPATLMQRNGRVARLGQVTDVVAYYLILTGTHEERRDSALQAKFADLGIDDEALKSRILGSLSEEEEQHLEQAIEDNAEGVVGNILKKAKNDNEQMDKDLAGITANLQASQVLNRDDLEKRLANWNEMGLPDAAVDGIKFEFDSIKWDRPVFGEIARMESTESKRARFQRNDDEDEKQELVFDPEYLIFGPKEAGSQLRLAGLPPWIKTSTLYGGPQIIPYDPSDLLGTLLQGVARLPGADFLSIPRDYLGNNVHVPDDACWLVFCTHPLREAENVLPPKLRPFLTFYAFSELVDGVAPIPLNKEGADAAEIHEFLRCVEAHALKGALSGMDDHCHIETARKAGAMLQVWIESVTRFGAASFLEKEQFFVPIPVALVRIFD